MRTSLYDYCIAHNRGELLRQWHPGKNFADTDSISYGSRQKVWWRCEQGHEWQAPVYARTGAGSGCPYCSRRKLAPGEGTLESEFPELSKEWDFSKNEGLTPADVPPATHRKVWWVCGRGHRWQAQINARTRGTGCPVCSNRKVAVGENDLATTHPALASQWHPTKNGTLTPTKVVAGNRRKVWWRCERGHEWHATILSRTSAGVGCPVCDGKKVVPGENDLASEYPDVAAQWHPTKNGTLSPKKVTAFSNRKAWWLCSEGHEYVTVIATKVSASTGCPYCTGRKVFPGFNDLATLEPEIAEQWHPELNGALTPQMVTIGSHKRVWWQCADGHVWKAVVYSRTGEKKCGCPVCAGKVRKARYAATT